MSTNDDLIKDILTKMFYDTSKTLNENSNKFDKTINEQVTKTANCTLEASNLYKQAYSKVDTLAYNRAYDKKVYNRKYFWCLKDKKNWYFVKTLDQSKPDSKQKIQNFQKWYLEFIEKKTIKNENELITTSLCSKPCKYSQAVDGVFGDNVKKLWSKYSSVYKVYNPKFNTSETFDWKKTQSDYKLKQYPELAKIFRFTTLNPSGWDYNSNLPKSITEKTSTYAKYKSDECPFYKGWDLLNETFPKPRKYTTEELSKLEYVTVDQDALSKIESEKQSREDIILQKSSIKSDRLGYDRYRPDPQGVGQTKAETDYERSQQEYSKKKSEIAGFLEGAKAWNKEYDRVVNELQDKCGRPMMFCDTSRKNANGEQINDNCVYISYSDVCRRAGGLWVYNSGTNNAWCGCRSMSSSGLTATNGTMIQFKGPKGSFTSTIKWSRSLEYQTPGTGLGDREEREKEHEFWMYLELGLTVAGFASGPFAPLFLGAASVVGFVDGIKYIQEGDTHMGVMMLSLSLLGVPEIASAFRLLKSEAKVVGLLNKYGKDGLQKLVKSGVEVPQLLGAAEKAELAILKDAAISSQRLLGKKVVEKMTKNVLSEIGETAIKNGWDLKDLTKIVWNFSEKQPTLKGILIYLGGVPYTIDQVYLAMYGNDLDRQRSGIATLFDYITKNPRATQEAINVAWLKLQAEIQKIAAESTQVDIVKLLADMLKTSKNGKIDTSMLESDESVLARLRQQGKLKSPQATPEDMELQNKEQEKLKRWEEQKSNCDKIESLKNLGWKEVDKTTFVKEKQKNVKDPNYPSENCKTFNCFEKLTCQDKQNYFIYNQPNQSGGMPIQTSIVDNPN